MSWDMWGNSVVSGKPWNAPCSVAPLLRWARLEVWGSETSESTAACDDTFPNISQFQLLHTQKKHWVPRASHRQFTKSLRVPCRNVAMKAAGRIWLSFFDRFIFSGWEETTSISKQCWNPNNIDGSLQSVKSNDKPSMTHNNNPGKDGKYNIMWQHMATPIINHPENHYQWGTINHPQIICRASHSCMCLPPLVLAASSASTVKPKFHVQ